MKKTFTKMIAALALLACVFIPLGMNAAEDDAHDFPQNISQSLNNNATIDPINIAQQEYSVKEVIITYAYNKSNDVRCSVSVNNTDWGTQSFESTSNLTTYKTLSFTGEPEQGAIVVSFTNNSGTGTGKGTLKITNVRLVEGPSSGGDTPPTPTTYTVTYDCNGGTSGCPENVTGITAGASITLAAAPTKTDYTFDGWNDGTTTYDAGDSYTVNGNVTMTAQWQLNASYLFYESFDDCNGTGGNDNQWSGSIASSTLTAVNNDWTFVKGNGAYKCAKFGTGSALGSAQTPAINHTGNATLTFKAAAWNGGSESTTLKLSATSGTLSASTVTLVKGAWTDYTINITGITTSTQIKFEGNATNNSRFFLDEVMVVEAAPSTDPAITASDVNIAYDATSGSIEYTLQNGTGNVSATITSGDWLTLGTITSSTVPFTCSANTSNTARTATVTLSYTGASDKVVTVTQAINPNLANIAALTAQTAGEYTVTLTDALVTYTNGTSAYLEDASGAVLLYHCNDNNLNLAVGDKITGTANVTYTVYNNLPEVTAFTLATGYTLTSGNTVTPAVVTIADLENNYTSYISRYVKIENATVTSAFSNKNCTIEQNSSSIVLRDQNSSATLETTQGDIVTVTAHPSIYNSTHQIAVYEQSQIVVAKVNPTITFKNGTLRVGQTLDLSTLFSSNSNGAVTYSITTGGSYATLTGSELTGTAEGSVTVKAVQAETTSYNEGEATATITVNPALVLSSIAVTTAPTKTTYNEGESFDPTGMVVTATYTDNSTEAVTGYTYSPDGALATTDTEITISYTENSVTKTTTQAITVNEVVDYATLPFEFDDGKADIENTIGLTQNGIDNSDYSSSPKLKFKTEGCYLILKINETPGELTFDIKGNGMSGTYEFSVMTSTDGITYETNTSYTSISGSTESKTINNLASDVRYIKWVYTTKDQGNVGLGNIVLAAYVAPGNSAPVWSALPTPTIAVNAEYELDLSTYVTGTPTPTITLTTSVSSNLYEFEDGLLMFQPTEAGSYEFTFTASNSEGTADATLTVTAAEVATYTLATSITSGRHYVIAATTSNVTKAMGGKNASKDYYDAIDASIDGNTITVPANSEIQEFVIVGPNADGYYYIYDPVAGGYLYASSSGSNDLSYQTPNDANGLWEIDFTNSTVTAQGANTHNLLRYNNGNPRFSCYTTGQTAIAFYEKNETTPQYDFYVDIAAWTVDENDPDDQTVKTDNWYFISSPIASPYILEGTDMVSGTYEDYDLYRLNNTTWENYNEHSDFTTLNNGTGYLYANSQDITLHFSGAINEFKTDNNANVKSLTEGWNLIGNPYNIPIFINKPYYRMNANGDDIETEDGITSKAIPACTGVVVKATYGESVTFSTSAPSNSTGNNGNIQIALAQNLVTRGGNNATTIDNAIVSFNEGSQLQKFYFGTQNANIYIPQGTEEYAIVNAGTYGEMPVCFKANEDGQYTISINTENVEMNYLHLIDNITGADTDLLVDPSYTFNAQTTDYASRFRLVFSANSVNETETENDNFAFISNGQIIVTTDASNASLQMIDMMGRIVSTQQVNGSSTFMAPVAKGVYMLQLINGSNVKTQKIVVK